MSKNGNKASDSTANVPTLAPANDNDVTDVTYNGFTSRIDYRNREHFRKGGNVRLERDYANSRLLLHVFDKGTLILSQKRMSAENVSRGWFHAFGQRIPDSIAQATNNVERWDGMKRLTDHYNSGSTEWNIERENVGEHTILVEALIRENGKRDRAAVVAFVNEKTATERTKMLNSVRLREHVTAIRAERNKGVNETELFSGLDE